MSVEALTIVNEKNAFFFLIAIAFDERHFSLFFSDKNSIETAEVRTKYSFQKHFYCKVNNGVCFRGGVGVNRPSAYGR